MPRHIRLINIGYPPFFGGAQTYVHLLATSLAAGGDCAEVFTTTAGEVEAIWNRRKRGLAAGITKAEGVQVHRVPLAHLPPAPYGYYGMRRLTVALAQAPGIPPSLLTRLARFTPWVPALDTALDAASGPVDLVHGFAIPFESLLAAGLRHARRRGVPFVVTPFLHTGEVGDPTVERGYAMPHQIAIMREADAVVTLTGIEREFLLQRGLAPERVHVIPAGIDVAPEVLDAPAPEPVQPAMVLFLGAVTYDKGAVHLLRAMRVLASAEVPVRLVVAGTVTGQFTRALAELPPHARERVEVLGNVSMEHKDRLLRECTVLAMPSRVDSFGLVFLEAWAAGRPVLGAQAGGIPGVLNHMKNGMLVSFGDVPDIAASIRWLVEHPAEARAMGMAGREKLRERYLWPDVARQVTDLYDRLIAQ